MSGPHPGEPQQPHGGGDTCLRRTGNFPQKKEDGHREAPPPALRPVPRSGQSDVPSSRSITPGSCSQTKFELQRARLSGLAGPCTGLPVVRTERGLPSPDAHTPSAENTPRSAPWSARPPRAGVCSPPPGTTEYPQQKQQGWSVTRGLESQKMQVSLVSPEGRPQQCLREHWARFKSPFCPRMLPFLQGGASPHAGLSLASLAGSSRMTGSPGSADGQRPAQGTGWRGPRRSGLCVPGGPGRWGGRFAPPGVPGFKVSPRVGRAAGLAVGCEHRGPGRALREAGGGLLQRPAAPLASRPPSCVGSG